MIAHNDDRRPNSLAIESGDEYSKEFLELFFSIVLDASILKEIER